MRSAFVYFTLVLLGVVALAAAQSGRRYPGGSQKPGSCLRPQRYRREVLVEVEPSEVEEQEHEIVKRQIQGGNGVRPGYPNPGWGFKPTAPVRTTTRRPRCYSDYDCLGNQKCCSGNCQTPAFIG